MRFIHIREKDIKEDDIMLIGLGDVHYGSLDCNYEKVKETVNWIKRKPNARVILMGDLLDVGLKDSIGGGSFDNDSTPSAQIENMIELLMPIREKIWCMLTGNHEERIRQRTSIDISRLIANALDIPYCGTTTFIKVFFGGHNYTIFATHGSSGATTPVGKINTVVKYGSYIDADLFMMGHVHDLMHHVTDYFRISNKDKMIIKGKRHYVITGHFLKYGGYAEAKGYIPGKTGVAKILLSKNKKSIYVSI